MAKPISKKDINYSFNGEQPEAGEHVNTDVHDIIPEGRIKTHRVFKLLNKSKKGRVHLPCIEDVINPATKRRERMRVLLGVGDIWMKNQKDYDDNYVIKNLRLLTFETSFLRVPIDDQALLEFIENSSHFKSSKDNTNNDFDFFEYDPQRIAEEALEKEYKEMEMVAKASTVPFEQMKKHFVYLKGSLVDELGALKSEKSVRMEYMRQAKRNPYLFEKSLNSKEVEVGYSVKRAIIDNLIDLGKTPGGAHWGSGAFICKIPAARKPAEYLIELAMTNSVEGQTFLEQLQNLTQ